MSDNYVFSFTRQHLEIIVASLGKQPYEAVAAVIDNIQKQFATQEAARNQPKEEREQPVEQEG